MTYKCLNCSKPVERQPSQIEKSGNVFCSQSCAATYSNLRNARRKLNKICRTPGCGRKILSNYTYCPECILSEKHLHGGKSIANKTISELLYNKNDANRYSLIRFHARKVARASGMDKCSICGYSKHVQIAHKKSISSFPTTTLVKNVNDPKNLIPLCPNHHWEFDHNLLDTNAPGRS